MAIKKSGRFDSAWRDLGEHLGERQRSLENERQRREEFLDKFRVVVRRVIIPLFEEAEAASPEGVTSGADFDGIHCASLTVSYRGDSDGSPMIHQLKYEADAGRRMVKVDMLTWSGGLPTAWEEIDDISSDSVERTIRAFIKAIRTG